MTGQIRLRTSIAVGMLTVFAQMILILQGLIPPPTDVQINFLLMSPIKMVLLELLGGSFGFSAMRFVCRNSMLLRYGLP
jgi:hypothetical protein